MKDEPVEIGVGYEWTGRPIRVSRESIVAFAREFDPQEMHLNEHSAAAARFGDIIASGWHVAALVMRDLVDSTPFGQQQLLGMALDELRWIKPVFPGDTLLATRKIEELRTSRSRPDWRIARTTSSVRNQSGDEVMRFLTAIQLPLGPTTS